MSQLIPCPGCQRHVRKHEAECPFCNVALDLAGAPEPVLPSRRLGRAATFAFGATLVSATALGACGGESEEGKEDGKGGSSSAGTSSTAGTSNGGTMASGGDSFAGAGTAVYGAPAAGSGGDVSAGGTGGPAPLYGAVPAGGTDTGTGGTGNPQPVYGAAPAP